ncbi:MAG: glycogen synthase [Myxococcales bacterium]|nr:glycogen synthase [Myxococcales bacterium]
MRKPLRVLHVTGEVAPYSKTGGLGDVLNELPRQQRADGLQSRVITPLYGHIDRRHLKRADPITVLLAGQKFNGRFWESPDDSVIFVDLPGLLDREGNYGGPSGDYPDNPLRFAALCKVAAALSETADVYHLHDWQAGLTALYLGGRRPVALTVHNLAYQGLCGFEWADRLGIPHALRNFDGVEYYGRVSLLKAGLVLSDVLTTVSPTYAREIQVEPGGLGLAGLFRHRRTGLRGILNGIDTALWNPATDRALPAQYTADDLSGKGTCKTALQRALGLSDGPLIAVISRAASQKGLDLLAEAAPAAMHAGARFAVLASGDANVLASMARLSQHHPGRFVVVNDFDDGLARRMYAGADFVAVPSRYEPCGLTQLIGMRYGTVPIVRATGGLADTVEDGVNGLRFGPATAEACRGALQRAVTLYADRKAYVAMQADGLARDWSWAGPAAAYARTYAEMIERTEPPGALGGLL